MIGLNRNSFYNVNSRALHALKINVNVFFFVELDVRDDVQQVVGLKHDVEWTVECKVEETERTLSYRWRSELWWTVMVSICNPMQHAR